MHEYSIVSSLLDRIGVEAAKHGASAVHSVRLRVGELSGVEIDLLQSAFEISVPKTICDGAQLEVVPAPASWTCSECGQAIAGGAILRCPVCDRPARLVAGDEILLERIEMEVA